MILDIGIMLGLTCLLIWMIRKVIYEASEWELLLKDMLHMCKEKLRKKKENNNES